MARIRAVFANPRHDAKSNHDLCRRFGAVPHIRQRRQPHRSGPGQRRWPVERGNAWLPENKSLALRYDRIAFVIHSLLQTGRIFVVAGRPVRVLGDTTN